MTDRTLRGQTAIVGIGETTYYRHGQSPDAEFKLALQAVVAACKDAGISPHDIDGFASYGNDRSEAGRLAAAPVATGMADCVVAIRSLAQGQFSRYGRGTGAPLVAGDDQFIIPYGVM